MTRVGKVAGAIIGLVTIAAVSGIAAPAYATPPGGCNGTFETFCVWENSHFSGGFNWLSSSQTKLSNLHYNNGHSEDNSISSVYNNSPCEVTMYQFTSYSGQPWYTDSNGEYANLSAFGSQYNDEASSAKFNC